MLSRCQRSGKAATYSARSCCRTTRDLGCFARRHNSKWCAWTSLLASSSRSSSVGRQPSRPSLPSSRCSRHGTATGWENAMTSTSGNGAANLEPRSGAAAISNALQKRQSNYTAAELLLSSFFGAKDHIATSRLVIRVSWSWRTNLAGSGHEPRSRW